MGNGPAYNSPAWRAAAERGARGLPPNVATPSPEAPGVIAGQIPLPTGTAGSVRMVGTQRWFRLVVTNPGGTSYAWYDEAGLEAQIEQLQRALTTMRTGLVVPPGEVQGGIRGVLRNGPGTETGRGGSGDH